MNDITKHRAALYFMVAVKSLEGMGPHMAILATWGSPSPSPSQPLLSPRLQSILQISVLLTLRQDAFIVFALPLTQLEWWKTVQNGTLIVFKKAIWHQKGDVDKEHWDALTEAFLNTWLWPWKHADAKPMMLQPALSRHSYLIYF